MTQKYLFCYTRTQNIDYRNIYGVDTSICPQSIQDVFLGRISALLNNTVDENLNNPMYIYFRQDDFILIGIVCLNCVLSAHYCLERTNGRVRGFFGMIENVSDIVWSIPYSLDFYIKLYEKYIIPKWSSYTFHYKENILVDIPVDDSDCVKNTSSVGTLNNNINICRVFLSPRHSMKLLSEALVYKGNMSIAIGISNKEQVTEDNFPLMNATLKNDECRSYEDIPVYHTCSKCREKTKQILSDGLCVECNEKQIVDAYKTKENSIISNDQQVICKKCGKNVVELYTEKGLCAECYKEYVVDKQKSHRTIGILMGIVIFVLLLLLLSPKPFSEILDIGRTPMRKDKSCLNPTSVVGSSKDTLIIDTLSKRT